MLRRWLYESAPARKALAANRIASTLESMTNTQLRAICQ